MNKAASWLSLVALCPLAAIGLPWAEALLLAGMLALTLLVVGAGLLSVRKVLVSDQQPIIAALLAAIVTSVLDLVLQALWHTHTGELQPLLPLTIVVAVLFCRVDADVPALDLLRTTALRASAFTAALLLGAALHAVLPEEARIASSLITCGLLLAIVAKFAPQTTEAISTRRPRARVTGPLR